MGSDLNTKYILCFNHQSYTTEYDTPFNNKGTMYFVMRSDDYVEPKITC